MRGNNKKILLVALVVLWVAGDANAQTISGEVEELHLVLSRIYGEMIPLADRLIAVGRGLAGFAAIWYIGMRVWGHIARSEPVDLYPLLRPFAIGLAILAFPQVLALINGLMSPIIWATSEMVEDSNRAVALHIEQLKTREAEPYLHYGQEGGTEEFPETEEDRGILERMRNELFEFNLKAIFNQLVSGLLQILFFSAALCINTIRTFQLVVLSILGPIVFGLSVFDGFQHTLPAWFARYINVSLWLPVANIFGAIIAKIQLNMLVLDGNFTSSLGYMVFMVIAIIGYATVPNVAGFIVQPGGRDSLLTKTTQAAGTGATAMTRMIKS
ncbi:conjugative transposon protein TraJ [Algoriphagus terrigena]|uniref:conjugative transposon protein TraJ n=1 Tax=Algoriphagus terrigena TaxID=344884 RepID=UPI000424D2C4|nr:conjugative transposon protein TraJ [Algoriphagus terrigena]